ncbi:MAG: YceI family protein [Anaerolineae bacterium]
MRRWLVFVLLVIVWGVILSACDGQEPAPPAPPVPTETPLPEPTPEPTPGPMPTETMAVQEIEAGVAATAELAETVPDGTRTFVIVPEESEASYIAAEEFFSGAVERLGKTLGLTDTIGRTNEIEGAFQLSPDEPFPLVSNHFIVNIQSLASDDRRRDERLREQWLESFRYPEAEFTATAVEGFRYVEGEEVNFTLTGDMTIREITNSVTFDVTAVLEGDTIRGAATAPMRMSDYGFDPPAFGNFFTVEDEFTVVVVFTAREDSIQEDRLPSEG